MDSFFLVVVAASLTLASLIQGLVAIIQFKQHVGKPWVFVSCMIVCLLIAGLAGYGARQQSAPTSTRPPAQPSPSVMAIGSQTLSPTTQPTDTPTQSGSSPHKLFMAKFSDPSNWTPGGWTASGHVITSSKPRHTSFTNVGNDDDRRTLLRFGEK